jgi:outer membrane protein TolC
VEGVPDASDLTSRLHTYGPALPSALVKQASCLSHQDSPASHPYTAPHARISVPSTSTREFGYPWGCRNKWKSSDYCFPRNDGEENFIRCALRRIIAAMALSLIVLACSGCMALPGKASDARNSLLELKSALLDPFGIVDSVLIPRAAADANVRETRGRSASAATGKRGFTHEDCRSIALANNLDLQVARMDQITKESIEYSTKTKLLPHLLFSGDLSQRDNQSYAFSEVMGMEGVGPKRFPTGVDNQGVTSYSTGHERGTWRYVLETRWSPTDAALAYYLSKSSINDTLKAHYQKLRVAQKLIATVDAAFFRLLGLQECLPMAERLCAARRMVAGKMRTAFEKKIVNVDEYNKAKQNCIRADRLLGRLRNEMEKQRNILASAMAISPEYCVDGGFYVIGPLVPPQFSMQLCDMELAAVRNRPEAAESGLSALSSTNDLKRAIVKYCPKVTGFWRFTRDKDKFLYNKDWKEVGVSVYFDLLDWLGNHEEFKAAKSHALKTQRETGSVALGITSQVRLAALQYLDSLDELQANRAALNGTSEVVEVAEKRAVREDLDRLALEEVRASLLQNQIDLTKTLGEANATLSELQAAMGTNYTEGKPEH